MEIFSLSQYENYYLRLILNLLGSQLAVVFLHNDHGDRDVFWQTNWGAEMTHKSYQEVENGNDIFRVDALDCPFGSCVMETERLK